MAVGTGYLYGLEQRGLNKHMVALAIVLQRLRRSNTRAKPKPKKTLES